MYFFHVDSLTPLHFSLSRIIVSPVAEILLEEDDVFDSFFLDLWYSVTINCN